MALDPTRLGPEVVDFLTERHLASLTLVLPGQPPHVSAIGFTWDDTTQTARIITFAASKKVRLISDHLVGEPAGAGVPVGITAAICQIDGGRWLALHGTATVSADPEVNADAEQRYAARYRPPGDRGADRRTIEVAVTSLVGRA